jgi:hypothetical protein
MRIRIKSACLNRKRRIGLERLAQRYAQCPFFRAEEQLGDSAVHGLGFGAGASIASNIVNKSKQKNALAER